MLKIWIPLNGNIKNLGLDPADITPSNITYSAGKQGECCCFNGSSSCLQFTNNFLTSETEEFSICAWIKFSAVGRTETLLSCRTSNGQGISIFKTSGNLFRFDAGTTQQQWNINYTFTSTAWNHVCFTRDPAGRRFYLNGRLVSSTSITGDLSSTGTKVSIAASSLNGSGLNNYMNGYMNDFRIYDHSLSEKEVAVLAQGLVLHYPLNQLGKGQNLALSTSLPRRYSTFTGKQNDCSTMYTIDSSSLSAGDIITVSFLFEYSGLTYIEGSSKLVYLQGSGDVTNWSPGLTGHSFTDKIAFGADKSGSLQISYSFTLTQTQADNSKFYTNLRTDYITGGSFTVTQFKAEKGNTSTSWSPSRDDLSFINSGYLTEYDCSGLGHHTTGLAGAIPSWNSDSPVYDGGYHFTALNRLAICKHPFEAFEQGTVTFWMKVNSFKSWDHYVFIADSFNWTGKESDFIIVARTGASADTINFNCCSNGIQYKPILGQWFHAAMQYNLNNNTYKLYINGTQLSQKTDAKINPVYASKRSYCSIGNVYSNTSYQSDFVLSDFRIYSTALSASDIKSLYETRFSLSSNGSLFAKELFEQETLPGCSLKNNGAIWSAALEESGGQLKITNNKAATYQFIET